MNTSRTTARTAYRSETGKPPISHLALIADIPPMAPATVIRKPSIKRRPWRVTDGITPEVRISHK